MSYGPAAIPDPGSRAGVARTKGVRPSGETDTLCTMRTPLRVILALSALFFSGCSSPAEGPPSGTAPTGPPSQAPEPGRQSGEEPGPGPAADAAPTTGEVSSADGVTIRYEARGAGSPALVFVHGWCGERGLWRNQLESFSEDHRVVALDLGGHGESGRNRTDWTTEAFAADVRAVIEALGLQRVILVGHSNGAAISLRVARDLRWRVDGVVGVDALHDVGLAWDEAELEPIVAEVGRDYAGFVERFVRTQCGEGASPELLASITARMAATDRTVALRTLRALVGGDSKGALAACPCPVVCINSDGLRRTHVAGNRKFSPTFEATVMPGVGYFLMLERPAAFDAELAKMLRILAGLRAGR